MHPDLGDRQESTSQSRLLANKYRDPESLERAYMELQTHSNQQHSRLLEMEERMANLERIKQAASEHNPAEALDELGIPVDDVRLLIQREVDAKLQPIFELQRARETVTKAYPDFDKLEDDVAQWLSQNRHLAERYGRMFQADQAGAMEWAINGYLKATESNNSDRRNPDASLPPQNSGMSRDATGIDAEEIKKEMDRAQQTGDWGRYVTLRLSQTTPASHFQGLNSSNR